MPKTEFLTHPGEKDYNNMRSDYRHNKPVPQERADAIETERAQARKETATQGNYNPASGAYENRADNLPASAEFTDQQFTNEYREDIGFANRDASRDAASTRGYGNLSDNYKTDNKDGGGYEPGGHRTSSYQSESEGNYQQRGSKAPAQGQEQQKGESETERELRVSPDQTSFLESEDD